MRGYLRVGGTPDPAVFCRRTGCCIQRAAQQSGQPAVVRGRRYRKRGRCANVLRCSRQTKVGLQPGLQTRHKWFESPGRPHCDTGGFAAHPHERVKGLSSRRAVMDRSEVDGFLVDPFGPRIDEEHSSESAAVQPGVWHVQQEAPPAPAVTLFGGLCHQ